MKKLFCFVAFLFALTSMAIAQLNVISYVETKPEKIKVIQPQYSWLYKTSNGYQIWANSDNHIDRHYNAIQLGETPEQCLQTLTDLYSIIENQVATLEVQQNDDKLFITTDSQLGVKRAWFRAVGVNAGRSWVSKNQVLSLIDYFNSMISEETLKTEPQDTIVQVPVAVQSE